MSERINTLFTQVSTHYDFMNHFLSFGIDKNWREETIKLSIAKLSSIKNPIILDIATGTGDLAILLSRELEKSRKDYKIIAMDFNKEMLELGRKKAVMMNCKKISFEVSDAIKTKYPENSFDAAISAFALRNLDDLNAFAKELKRILKKNGSFIFVDMAVPDEKPKEFFFKTYSIFMRFVGFFVDNEAYKWLVSSISKFDKKNFIKILKKNGFKNIQYLELKTGVAYIISGNK